MNGEIPQLSVTFIYTFLLTFYVRRFRWDRLFYLFNVNSAKNTFSPKSINVVSLQILLRCNNHTRTYLLMSADIWIPDGNNELFITVMRFIRLLDLTQMMHLIVVGKSLSFWLENLRNFYVYWHWGCFFSLLLRLRIPYIIINIGRSYYLHYNSSIGL